MCTQVNRADAGAEKLSGGSGAAQPESVTRFSAYHRLLPKLVWGEFNWLRIAGEIFLFSRYSAMILSAEENESVSSGAELGGLALTAIARSKGDRKANMIIAIAPPIKKTNPIPDQRN